MIHLAEADLAASDGLTHQTLGRQCSFCYHGTGDSRRLPYVAGVLNCPDCGGQDAEDYE